MIDFASAEIKPLIKRKSDCNTVNLSLILGEFIFALAAAALSRYTDKYMWLFITMLCLFGAGACALVLFNVLYAKNVGARLKYGICRTISNAFYADEELLTGAKVVELTASYDGNSLQIARVGFLKEIKISGARGLNTETGRLVFDLSALKPSSSVYSSVGENVLAFLEAYYRVNCKTGGYRTVTVNDDTGKKRNTYTLVDSGAAVTENAANYFLKKGLIK